jgi:uncharacterized protein YjbI with pentapeptide repeats
MNETDLLTCYKQGQRDFRKLNLHESSLMGAQLSNSLLQESNFAVANLTNANLSHCNLSECNFNVARLNGANLSHSQLFRANLNVANLIRANFKAANLTEVSMVRAEAMRCELSKTNLRQANLSESDLRESQIRWSDLSYANLSQAHLQKSVLAGSRLVQATLHNADLSGADLRSVILQDADLKHANLTGANLAGANLRGCNLRWADLSEANLQDADLTGAKLSGATLIKTNFQGADLSKTSFIHADLSHANLRYTYWHGANLTEATLTGVKLHGSHRFHLMIQDLICDWVDLAPTPETPEIVTLRSDQERQCFFNWAQPSVQILVDAPIAFEGHRVLAKLYHHMAKNFDEAEAPPSLEVSQRKTQITFYVAQDTHLFALAYFATLPFSASHSVQRHLKTLTSMLQSYNIERLSGTYYQRLHQINQGLITLCQRFARQPKISYQSSGEAIHFFHKPIQVQLTNSQGQCLELFHDHAFGVRPLEGLDTDWPTDPETEPTCPVSLDQLIGFLVGIRAEHTY